MKVLISVYACEPGKGSEPGTGWNIVKGLSELHQVTALTRTNNRSVIEEAQRRGEAGKATFIYYDPPNWLTRLKRKRLLPLTVYYTLWQLGAYLRHRGTARSANFDIIHHLTFNAFEHPGFLWLLPARFVLGPIGGGQTVPFRLLREFGSGGFLELIRNLRVVSSTWNPIVRIALRKAAFILFANPDTAGRVGRKYTAKSRIMVDVGVDASAFQPRVVSDSEILQVLFVGRMERRKGIALLLRAIRQLRNSSNVRWLVIGDGPLRPWFTARLEEERLTDRVDFLRFCPHRELREKFAASDLFLFPSLRDTTGSVVLEAMATGLPVICLDHQGAATMTSPECAIRIPPSTGEQMSAEIAAAIESLRESKRRMRMGMEGRKRVEEKFDWSVKVKKISAVYDSVMTEEPEKLVGSTNAHWEGTVKHEFAAVDRKH